MFSVKQENKKKNQENKKKNVQRKKLKIQKIMERKFNLCVKEVHREDESHRTEQIL